MCLKRKIGIRIHLYVESLAFSSINKGTNSNIILASKVGEFFLGIRLYALFKSKVIKYFLRYFDSASFIFQMNKYDPLFLIIVDQRIHSRFCKHKTIAPVGGCIVGIVTVVRDKLKNAAFVEKISEP